jgi:hypothetical protein
VLLHAKHVKREFVIGLGAYLLPKLSCQETPIHGFFGFAIEHQEGGDLLHRRFVARGL